MATIKEVAEVLVKINDEEAKKQLPALQQKVKDLNKQFDELRNNNAPNDKIKEVGKELKKTYEQADALRKRTQSIDEAMQNLSLAKPKELRQLMARINGELNSGAIERGTKEWDDYCDKLKQVKTELKKIADEQKVVTDSGLSMKDMLDIGGNLSMIAASVLQVKDSVAEFMRDNVNSYIELDAEMANVQKYTSLTREQIELLNRELDKLDTRTSKIKLNQLVEEGGRGGLRSIEELVQYAKAADIINVALDELGEGATETIFKLSTIFGDKDKLGVEGSMMAVGSVVNDLSQNMVAQAPYITEYINRLSGIGAMAKMTIPQIAAYGAVLDANGQNVEKSATATSRLLNKMFQEPAKIAQVASLEISSFTQLVKTDINAAFMMLLEHLNSLGKMDVLAPIFKDMNIQGDGATATLTTLAKNIELVKQKQQEAKAAYEDATSVIKESNVQNTTEEAKLEKKRKKFEEVKVALGKELLPVMSSFVSTGSMMAKLLLSLIQFTKEHHKAIISIAAGLAAYTITVKAHTIATTATTVATKAWNLLTKAGTTLQAAYKIVLSATTLAYAKLTGNTVMATTAQEALNTAMKSNHIGLIIGAITTAAVAIWNYSKKVNEANKKEKELTDISQMTADAAKEEINALNRLYEAATSETESKENRLKAAKKLQDLYPNYFKNLNAEAIIVGKAKVRYDELTTSIINSARAKAAASLIEQHEGTILQKKQELQDLIPSYNAKLTAKKNAQNEYDEAYERYKENLDANKATAGFTETQIALGTITAPSLENLNKANSEFTVVDNQKKALENDIKNLNSAIETLKQNYKDAGGDLETMVKGILPEGGNNGDDKEKNAAKDWLDKEDAINRAAYATGQIDYEEFLNKKHEILLAYYDKMLQDTSLSETKRLEVLADKAEEELNWSKKQQEKFLQQSLADIDKEYESAKARETAWYYDIANENYGNEKILHEKLFQANVEYLKEKEQLYRAQGNNMEADNVLLEREQLVNDEKLRKQKEFFSLYNRLQKNYLKASNEEKMAAELETLDALHKEGIVKEVEYQELRKAIEEKYSAKGTKVKDNGFGDMLSNLYTSWDTLISGTTDKTLTSMQKIGAVAQSTWAIAGAALQQYSAYSQACCDVEVAEIEAKYEKGIKAAGKNQKRVALLEEQKEKDIAKVKGKYNKKAMTIEMAQAVAQTAMAAINAYASAAAIPVVGYILAPIAAAMAVAAGAMQIETIKKQHQVQQTGYYGGGFTKRSANDREEVGVVHANEFVVNAQATRNPVVTPFLSLLDHAQRNNTVSSLTAADVSHSMGMGAVVRANTAVSSAMSDENSARIVAVTSAMTASARAIDRLNKQLEGGIESYMVMDGERGFDRRYTEYNKMKNRPRR